MRLADLSAGIRGPSRRGPDDTLRRTFLGLPAMSLGSFLSRITPTMRAEFALARSVNRDDCIFATVRPTLRRIAQVQDACL